ncbi:Outer membrane protein beta-barrel domain-containing protein [Chryseolinea serpens]|uniref:Outer membrane protein beta-barrel domain-containing protein n=2 Tax=Chryseolinea serpens TaxID=947013 RepID=A0A1M5X0S4_9BACT|nr:Outer membrane protein beta-barrel domain-containing protein [Chryseolinea serpens]
MAMKTKILLTCFALACALAASSQNFKKFRVGIGVGYAKPSGSGSRGGGLVYLEPSYRLSDALSLGLRVESAIVARGLSGSSVDMENFDLSTQSSYTLNVQYYLSTNNFRPFFGAGLGIHNLSAMKTDVIVVDGIDFTGQGQVQTHTESVNLSDAQSKLGFYPRLGFDLGHFTFSVDYNFIPNTKTTVSGSDASFRNNYLGVRLGANFGGGRK